MLYSIHIVYIKMEIGLKWNPLQIQTGLLGPSLVLKIITHIIWFRILKIWSIRPSSFDLGSIAGYLFEKLWIAYIWWIFVQGHGSTFTKVWCYSRKSLISIVIVYYLHFFSRIVKMTNRISDPWYDIKLSTSNFKIILLIIVECASLTILNVVLF